MIIKYPPFLNLRINYLREAVVTVEDKIFLLIRSSRSFYTNLKRIKHTTISVLFI